MNKLALVQTSCCEEPVWVAAE